MTRRVGAIARAEAALLKRLEETTRVAKDCRGKLEAAAHALQKQGSAAQLEKQIGSLRARARARGGGEEEACPSPLLLRPVGARSCSSRRSSRR